MSESLPVVMIPGLLLSSGLYAPQVEALWPHAALMIANHTREETMAALAQRILAEAPPRFCLVGLSMGGYISFEMLRQAPDRIARVALLDTSARADTPEVSAARRTQVRLAQEGHLDEVMSGLIPRLLHPDHVSDPALGALIRRMAAQVGPAAFARQQAAIIGRIDSRPHLSEVRCPALVLVGDSDQLTPPERATEIAEGIPGARLVVVPRCGHLSTLEQPGAVTAALQAWLSGETC